MKKLALAFVLSMTASWAFAAPAAAPTAPAAADAKAGVRKPTGDVEKFWNAQDWNKMSADEQKLWAVLGWDAKKWHGDKAQEPASENKNWAQLSKAEQDAASALGYDQKSWDAN
jgi:hypothetical protein